MKKDIESLRSEIDQLDRKILELLNNRASIALSIGGLKKDRGEPIFNPAREKLIHEKIKKINRGPLGEPAVHRLFERIIEETRSLEKAKNDKDAT